MFEFAFGVIVTVMLVGMLAPFRFAGMGMAVIFVAGFAAVPLFTVIMPLEGAALANFSFPAREPRRVHHRAPVPSVSSGLSEESLKARSDPEHDLCRLQCRGVRRLHGVGMRGGAALDDERGFPTPCMIEATSKWTGLIETTTLGVSANRGRQGEASRRTGGQSSNSSVSPNCPVAAAGVYGRALLETAWLCYYINCVML